MSSEEDQGASEPSKADAFDASVESQIEVLQEKKQHLETELKSLEEVMDMLEHKKEETPTDVTPEKSKKKVRKFKQKKMPYPVDFDQIFKFQGFVQHRRSTSFVVNGVYSLSLVHRETKRGAVAEAVRIPGYLLRRKLKDGSVEMEYPDGSVIVEAKQGKITYFVNGDIQHVFQDGSVAYFYASTSTLELSVYNGVKVFFFPERKEVHWPDGKKEIYKACGKQIVLNKGSRHVFRYERRKRPEK